MCVRACWRAPVCTRILVALESCEARTCSFQALTILLVWRRADILCPHPLVGTHTHSMVSKWTFELAQAIHFLHTLTPKIIHRDIKPGNVMLNHDLTCKLIDLGLSKTLSRAFIGMPAFKSGTQSLSQRILQNTTSCGLSVRDMAHVTPHVIATAPSGGGRPAPPAPPPGGPPRILQWRECCCSTNIYTHA